jgi:serine/threonine protein kinase
LQSLAYSECFSPKPGDGYMKQKDLNDKDDVHPRNNFTPLEKLKFALEMAESLAILHGHEEGRIVHDDVQLCQWLRNREGKLVLGDFNRAQILDWNEENQEYCGYNNGYAFGNVSHDIHCIFTTELKKRLNLLSLQSIDLQKNLPVEIWMKKLISFHLGIMYIAC